MKKIIFEYDIIFNLLKDSECTAWSFDDEFYSLYIKYDDKIYENTIYLKKSSLIKLLKNNEIIIDDILIVIHSD